MRGIHSVLLLVNPIVAIGNGAIGNGAIANVCMLLNC